MNFGFIENDFQKFFDKITSYFIMQLEKETVKEIYNIYQILIIGYCILKEDINILKDIYNITDENHNLIMEENKEILDVELSMEAIKNINNLLENVASSKRDFYDDNDDDIYMKKKKKINNINKNYNKYLLEENNDDNEKLNDELLDNLYNLFVTVIESLSSISLDFIKIISSFNNHKKIQDMYENFYEFDDALNNIKDNLNIEIIDNEEFENFYNAIDKVLSEKDKIKQKEMISSLMDTNRNGE